MRSHPLKVCMWAVFGIALLASFAGPFTAVYAQPVDPTAGSLNLVPCGRVWDASGQEWIEKECGFLDLIVLFHNVIEAFFVFLMLTLGFLLIRLGFKYMNAGGNVIKRQEITKGFKHLVVGIIIMICAWGVYKFVLEELLDQSVIQSPLE